MPGLPTPRRGLRALAITLTFILGPYFFVRHISTLDLSASSGSAYLHTRSKWAAFPEHAAGEGPDPRTVARRTGKRFDDAQTIAVDGTEFELAKDGTHRHKRKMPQHNYLANGLVTVNREGRHPVYDLIERAEDAWTVKVDAASKTLDEAVAEYRRRYGRAPPTGFDRW